MSNRQIPAPVFIAVIALVLLGVFALVSRPTAPRLDGDRPNKPAPEIVSVTPAGEPFRLGDYKGKVVLLNFWATWCGPCRMELPDLIRIQQKYAERGFTIVGIADEHDDDGKRLAAAVQKMGINYPVAFGTRDSSRAYGITAIPRTFLIDRKGNVVLALPANIITEGQISPEIEKLL